MTALNHIQDFLKYKNIPKDIEWNIIKYLSHPNSSLITPYNLEFKHHALYEFLHNKFNFFNPYCDRFIHFVLKKLIKLHQDNYIRWKETREAWLGEYRLGIKAYHDLLSELQPEVDGPCGQNVYTTYDLGWDCLHSDKGPWWTPEQEDDDLQMPLCESNEELARRAIGFKNGIPKSRCGICRFCTRTMTGPLFK